MRLPSLVRRLIGLFLFVTLLTACSSADGTTPSPTQTPILTTPTQTETATPSPTDTPTATPTPTEIPSYLSQLAPWKKGMGDSRDNFPMVDMTHASDWIREAVGKLVINQDGSSTYDGKPLFAADAPKARVTPFGSEGVYKIESGYKEWYLPLYGYKADHAHGGIIDGYTEYRMVVAINTDNGPVIVDIAYRYDTNGFWTLKEFDRKITEIGQKFIIYLAPASGDFGLNLINPELMRSGQFTSNGFEIFPEFVDLSASLKQFILPQVFTPIGGHLYSE